MRTPPNQYLYNGKELQEEMDLNWYDYGARMYDPVVGRWNGVDVQAERYGSVSPYAYVANNPMKFIDPNGEEIWIYYNDEDGNEQKVRYENGTVYNQDKSKFEGDNKFVSKVSEFLDKLNSADGGKEVISLLSKSKNNFDFKNKTVKGSNKVAGFGRRKEGGGVMAVAALLNEDMSEGQKFEIVTHELFHGYQHELPSSGDGKSFNDEVGAYLYGRMMRLRVGYPTYDMWGRTDKPEGAVYQEAMSNLYYSGFSKSAYEKAVKNFKNGSKANNPNDSDFNGLYNEHRLMPISDNPPIKQFLPVF